jgi:hypothetical protein
MLVKDLKGTGEREKVYATKQQQSESSFSVRE